MRHIYSERRSEWRDTLLGSCHDTPHSISTQEVRPRALVFPHSSAFDFAALLTVVCFFYFQASAQTIMESAICTIVTQFKNYAGKDGSSSTLSKEEFHNLVSSQLSNYVQVNLTSSSYSTHRWTLKKFWRAMQL